MKPTLIIGNKNYSSWSLRPWLVLKHMGVEFDEIRIPLDQQDTTVQIEQYSPSGLVPVYQEGELTIWDSLAICEYLAEQQPALWPRDRQARAVARAVSAEMHAGFAELRKTLPLNCRARGRRVALSEQVQRDIRRIQALWIACRHAHAGRGPWLFGEFSIADAMYAPVVLRFQTYGIDGPEPVRAYSDTVLADPPMQAWLAAAEAETETIVIGAAP